MFIVGLAKWWYTLGWKGRVGAVGQSLLGVYDYFSIDLLIRTLFAPFKQDSAGRVDGPLNVQMKAFFDQLTSRLIGAVMRTILIVIGSVTLLLVAVWGLVRLVIWPIVPSLPAVAVVLAMSGWIPWKI